MYTCCKQRPLCTLRALTACKQWLPTLPAPLYFPQPTGPRGEEGRPSEEHLLLDDNRYVADVLYELKAAKSREGFQSRLLFKKRMFRETDENISDPQFINLSFIQAQYDYLQVRINSAASGSQ